MDSDPSNNRKCFCSIAQLKEYVSLISESYQHKRSSLSFLVDPDPSQTLITLFTYSPYKLSLEQKYKLQYTIIILLLIFSIPPFSLRDEEKGKGLQQLGSKVVILTFCLLFTLLVYDLNTNSIVQWQSVSLEFGRSWVLIHPRPSHSITFNMVLTFSLRGVPHKNEFELCK